MTGSRVVRASDASTESSGRRMRRVVSMQRELMLYMAGAACRRWRWRSVQNHGCSAVGLVVLIVRYCLSEVQDMV